MWIRTQDKECLFNVDMVYIEKGEGAKYNVCFGIDAIGEYSSKEKALKVLDAIQSHIIQHNMAHFNLEAVISAINEVVNDKLNVVSKVMGNVFEMPQDDEV